MTIALTGPLPRIDPARSPRQLAWQRFTNNRLAVAGATCLIIIVGFCLLGLIYSLHPGPDGTPRYAKINFVAEPIPPLSHRTVTVADRPVPAPLLGTDKLGRDMLARLILGGAISLGVGVASATISVFIGTAVGLISGYVGGRTDAILMRIVDVLYSLPYILIVILLRVAFAPPLGKWFGGSANAQSWANVTILLIGIGSVSWLTMARIIRGQVLALRNQPFVEAAQALGLRPAAVLLKHILPNLLGTIIVYATLTVPRAILEESFLSFLGLGISPPLPSWGNIASDGVATINPISNWWWLTLLPSAAISITLLCLNFVGDGLRDALDPRSNR